MQNLEKKNKKIKILKNAKFSDLFEEIRQKTGNSSEAFVQEMYSRYVNRKRPFSTRDSTQRELVLSDGFYSIYYYYWLQFFKKNQLLIVDGSKISTNPAIELIRIQKFLNLEIEIDERNFVYNDERGFYCFKEGRYGGQLF